jgi:shikimate dehydrogenase
MQNAAFQRLGLQVSYELDDIAPSGLPEAVQRLRHEAVLGANVTTPHKVAVLELVDEVDASAARVGAANVIVRRDGRLVAHSTDLPAVARELERLAIAPGRAVVLGAGGASRAVTSALADRGWQGVSVIRRDDWASLPAWLADADLLVNATPIGTGDHETPVRANALRADLAVLDLVYRPSPTRLVTEARAAGAQARAGAGILLEQAVLSFALWTARAAPRSLMREALLSELGAGADV